MRTPAFAAAAVLALGAVWSAAPTAAQPAAGNYVAVATWEDSATTLPDGVWQRPAGLDLTPSGLVFVVDSRLRRVDVLDAAGQALRSFGRGAAPEDLVAPAHVAVDEGRDRVYVADPGARRVAVYTLAGDRVALWPVDGLPWGLAVAPDGRLALSDTDGDWVRVLAPDGRELARWGGSGAGRGQLDTPAGLHVAPDGTVWVADRGNGRLVAATLDGQALGSLSLGAPQLAGGEVLDVTVVGEALWVAAAGGLARLPVGGPGAALAGWLPDLGAAAVAADGTHGLFAAVDRDGRDGDYPGVWRYLPGQASGEPKARWGGPIRVPGFFDGLEALTVGDDGLAYLLDVPARIQRLSPAGAVLGQVLAPDPVEVDADAAGRLYAVAGDTLHALAPDGAEVWAARLRPPGAGVEVEVAGVAWDAAQGRVVVLDSGSRRCYTFDAAGAPLADWGPATRGPNGQYWADMAVGADGTLYLLDAGNHVLRGWDGARRLVLDVNVPVGTARFDVAPDGTLLLLGSDGWARRLGRDGTVQAEWDVARLDRGRGSRPVDLAVDGAGRVLVVDGVADLVTVYQWDPAAPPTPLPGVEAGCEVRGDKRAAPAELPLGETVEVSLVVRGQCAAGRELADIALLVDTRVERNQLKDARLAVEHFLTLVDPRTDRVAVQPGQPGGTLTNDLQYLRRVVRRIDPTTGYNLAPAIDSATDELFGRRGRPAARKVIVLLFNRLPEADSTWNRYLPIRAAGAAKRRGAEVFAIGFGRNADMELLRDLATDKDHLAQGRGGWQLEGLYARVAGQLQPAVLLRELTVTDEIPANMAYVAGSAEPPAAFRDRTLVWRLAPVPPGGLGLRYRLRPLEPGDWPTNVRAVGDYLDAAGEPGSLTFPVPRVRVIAPTATPTATATASPSPRPSDTPEATATARPTRTPTPTPRPRPVILPLVLAETCDPGLRQADVVLVIDASTSMLEPTSAGRTKLAAATDAARGFLDRLSPARDQAALVSFNLGASTLQPLTADRAALDAALARIAVDRGSRLDLGIAAAAAELASARHRPASQAAMIVLTDGQANPVGPELAVAEAARAKAAGVRVFTIGLGEVLDLEALRAIASQADGFYQTPDAEELAAIYGQIAARLPCPPSAFWP